MSSPYVQISCYINLKSNSWTSLRALDWDICQVWPFKIQISAKFQLIKKKNKIQLLTICQGPYIALFAKLKIHWFSTMHSGIRCGKISLRLWCTHMTWLISHLARVNPALGPIFCFYWNPDKIWGYLAFCFAQIGVLGAEIALFANLLQSQLWNSIARLKLNENFSNFQDFLICPRTIRYNQGLPPWFMHMHTKCTYWRRCIFS